MEILLTSISTAALLFIAGLWLKNYLPNYFNEKGKLLAQKEDIEEITRKIESVKIDFAKESESLKIELQRLLSLEVAHRTEERIVIINFYDKYNQWLYSLLEINYGAYHRINAKQLLDKRIYNEKFYAETSVAQAKIRLLVKDGEIIEISSKLLLALLEFKGWMDRKLLDLQHNLERHQSSTDQFLIIMKDFENNKALANSLAEDEKKIENERKELVADFYANRNDEYVKIVPIDTKFTQLVKSYLTK